VADLEQRLGGLLSGFLGPLRQGVFGIWGFIVYVASYAVEVEVEVEVVKSDEVGERE
jgi:hypothetical protein